MAASTRMVLQRLGAKGVAAGAGAAAVSTFGVQMATLQAKEQETLPFTMVTGKYDQNTFQGRLFTMFDKIDPRTLLLGDEEVKRCQGLIDEYARTQRIPAGKTDEEMWEARKIVEAVIHPVTKEPMFLLGRMSAFVPMNAPICALMLNASSPAAVVFSQWINQSYNVMNNYVNRSSLEVDWAELMKPYVLAVTVSCSIALGARKALQVVPALQRLGIFVPYFAVISAGSCNVAFTRMDEWNGRGISLISKEGKDLGMSVKAGQQAVLTTVCTRSMCLPIPVLLVPPVIMSALPVTGAAAMVTEMIVILSCLSFALPCALAILPQEMELSVAGLEPEFQSLTDSSGKPITTVLANKGL